MKTAIFVLNNMTITITPFYETFSEEFQKDSFSVLFQYKNGKKEIQDVELSDLPELFTNISKNMNAKTAEEIGC